MLTLNRPLVVLDLEATGTDPEKARIIQVAAMRIVPADAGPRWSQAFTKVVNPGVPVPERVRDLTGITQEQLDQGAPWPKVADRLGALIEDADLAGYNIASYDLPLLKAEYGRLNRNVPGPGSPTTQDRTIVDALSLERQLRPRTLEAVYERRMDEPMEDAHDAAADVKGTLAVLQDQWAEVGGTPQDLADFARGDYLDDGRKLREREDGAVEVCFGKHSGKTLQELRTEDRGYFRWMYETIDELRPHIDEAMA